MAGNYRYIPPTQKDLVVTMHGNNASTRTITELTEISMRTCQRVLEIWRKEGRVVRMSPLVGRPRALSSLDIEYLEALVEARPDAFLHELQEALAEGRDLIVSLQTISATLRRRGWTRKKISRQALERSEQHRLEFQREISQFRPDQLVFLDESATNRHTAQRTYGWAPSGDRARRHDFFVRGTRYSILPAISLSGVLHLDIITRSWTSEQFREYLDVLLHEMRPVPQPNSVLIMDNSSVHHFEGIRQIVEERGCRLVYLPAYSPDYNPIEEGFSSMKAWIRRNRDYVLGELEDGEGHEPFIMLWDAVHSTMTPDNIYGWFRDCGYAV